jgi:hypothetical protein
MKKQNLTGYIQYYKKMVGQTQRPWVRQKKKVFANSTFLISVKNMNLLSSSIYKHLKTYLIKHKQSLILSLGYKILHLFHREIPGFQRHLHYKNGLAWFGFMVLITTFNNISHCLSILFNYAILYK